MVVYIIICIACLSSLIVISILALRKSKSNTIAVVFSSIGIITSFLALSLSSPRDLSGLCPDYLGFIVAILAILTTLLVGMQLYHAFNLKEDAKEVAKAKEVIDDYAHKLEELTKKTDSLNATIDEMNMQTEEITKDINKLNDVTSDLMDKASHAAYLGDAEPCDDK